MVLVQDRPSVIGLSKPDGQPEIQIHVVSATTLIPAFHCRIAKSNLVTGYHGQLLNIKNPGFCIGKEEVPGLPIRVNPDRLKWRRYIIHYHIIGMMCENCIYISAAHCRGPTLNH